MSGTSIMATCVDTERFVIRMALCMKESGITTRGTGLGDSLASVGAFLRVIGKRERCTGQESTWHQMVIFSRACGIEGAIMVLSKSCTPKTAVFTKDNGASVSRTDKED